MMDLTGHLFCLCNFLPAGCGDTQRLWIHNTKHSKHLYTIEDK